MYGRGRYDAFHGEGTNTTTEPDGNGIPNDPDQSVITQLARLNAAERSWIHVIRAVITFLYLPAVPQSTPSP